MDGHEDAGEKEYERIWKAAVEGPSGDNSLEATLAHLDEVESKLQALRSDTIARLDAANAELQSHPLVQASGIEMLSEKMRSAQSAFERLEMRLSMVAHTASRIGNRLKSVHTLRETANEARRCIAHLFEFATTNKSLVGLSPLFVEEEHEKDAAAEVVKLRSILQEILAPAAANNNSAATTGAAAAPRSTALRNLRAASEHLELYAAALERRTLQAFRRGCAARDVEGMSRAVDVLRALGREELVQEEYLAAQAPALSPEGLGLDEEKISVSSVATQEPHQRLSLLLGATKALLSALQEEAQVLQSIYPEPEQALSDMLSRVAGRDGWLGQLAQGVFAVPDISDNANAEELLRFVNLLESAFERIEKLRAAAEPQLPFPCSAYSTHFPRGLLDRALSQHLAIERTVLRQLAQDLCSCLGDGGATVGDLIWTLVSGFRDAAERVRALAAPDRVAEDLLELYAGRGGDGGAGHLLGGVSVVVSAAFQAEARRARAAGAKPAQAFVRTMEVVGGVLGGMRALKAHYEEDVVAMLRDSEAAAASAQAAFAAARSGASSAIDAALAGAVSELRASLDAFLLRAQTKTDFKVAAGANIDVSRPTAACRGASSACLECTMSARGVLCAAGNLSAVEAEISAALASCVHAHVRRFTFCELGALQLKCDLSHYLDTVRRIAPPSKSAGAPAAGALRNGDAEARLEALAEQAALLVVPPESLPSLVDHSLGIGRSEALELLRLRDDFKTAKVGNRPLSVLFQAGVA
ncbi:unnamed protein product [Pedinophyceae sp. YPF-701]|nr:unnamed protein product [Pedinophyceae sp. YPF-701]